jgi:hypothetical protein
MMQTDASTVYIIHSRPLVKGDEEYRWQLEGATSPTTTTASIPRETRAIFFLLFESKVTP